MYIYLNVSEHQCFKNHNMQFSINFDLSVQVKLTRLLRLNKNLIEKSFYVTFYKHSAFIAEKR